MPSASRQLVSQATTRALTAARIGRGDVPLLEIGQLVTSPETHLEYRVERLIGSGGFGQAYLARRQRRSQSVPDTVCIKASRRMDGWLREAYFGQLLDGHERAIRVFDTFPLRAPGDGFIYCLVLEY